MSLMRTTLGTVGAIAAVAAAGLAFSPPARADALYQADRAYCMSGQATQARDLCLKEAAAAQAERQGGARIAQRSHHRKHRA